MHISTAAATLALLGTAQAYTLSVYTKDNYAGTRRSLSSQGSLTGNFHSYKWSKGSGGYCVRFCENKTYLGYRCDSYSNNAIWFNNARIYKYGTTMPSCPGA
ncbi:hypothetical protein HK097_009470 [Rhizophlyctis rosea]|uniref:Uncharacterized protein n=1 Tax=Rhizophlyctis rosea TaxID=64517 RepID=A0AAD5X3S2_9FUNG|nr:hypothetical protein HK097_009470 [Rhizophlyctis rosea]